MRFLAPVLLASLLIAATVAVSDVRPTPRTAQTIPGVGELGGPDRVLSPEEMDRWLTGRELFNRDFHVADGLGTPHYNADSCRACHQDPVMGGAGGLELNVSRFARDNDGAGPFQDLPGGQVLHKLSPPPDGAREEYTDLADVFEQRQSPAIFGAGRIEAISAAAILANEDPDDLDMNGIRGVARRLDVAGTTEIGRFGWKAQIPRLTDFTRDAMGIECGLTTPPDGRGFAVAADADAVQDPEMTEAEVNDVAFFMRHLAPPARVGSTHPDVLRGEELFATVGCADCHVPSLSEVPLFSDLLLHDVMPDDFRGMEEPGAPAGAYRTPPLWGIRLTAPYLHDGRAETLREAIEMHAGEAAATTARFNALPLAQQESLLRFLEDL